MARPGHRVPGHILGLGYTCTCILLVKLIKRLQNIILPDALFLYVGQPIKTREESNIPYLSVFPICSVLPLKGRPSIKLINTCGSRVTVSCQLLSIHLLNLQLIRTFIIINSRRLPREFIFSTVLDCRQSLSEVSLCFFSTWL